jgi:DNA-binding GntR family transcriptional regulator
MGLIQREGLSDLVYKQLHEMIENSRFTSGEKINVDQLAREMGVSRTPVWQAIRKLEAEGLLRSVPHKGVYMQELTPYDAISLYSVRAVLESMAGELAAKNITAEIIAEMEQNLTEQKHVIEEQDLVAYSHLDYEFHGAVYQSSKNKFLIEILSDIKKQMRPLVHNMNSILTDLYQDHVSILNALKERDSTAAKKYFLLHNERMKKLINKSLKEES